MKIGILGSGVVGNALARGFLSREQEVKIGSRTPGKINLKELSTVYGDRISAGTFKEAAEYGEMLIMCCLGSAVEDVIGLSGKENFNGKVLIDATNQLDFSKGKQPGMIYGLDKSLGQIVQSHLPDAKVVKCFNTVPSSQMVDPVFKDADMLICGNDPGAKKTVTDLLKQFGWRNSIDIGGIENAIWLEALVPLWLRIGTSINNWNHVVKFLY